MDSSVTAITLPHQPGLKDETMSYDYDAVGNPINMSGSASPPLSYIPEARCTQPGKPAVLTSPPADSPRRSNGPTTRRPSAGPVRR
jgi:hypothetical protein